MTVEWLSGVDWKRADPSPGRFRWGRLGEDYVGEWIGLFAIRTCSRGSVKSCWVPVDVPHAVVEKVVRGEASAFVRALHGKHSLHASAVARGGRALVLTGPSGVGKSTLASRLCETYGMSLLADDIAGLDVVGGTLKAVPSERAVWLDDGTGAKSPVPARLESTPVDVGLLVALSFDDSLDAPRADKLHGADAVRLLRDGLLRFDPSPDLWSREFDLLTLLGASVPLLRVARPPRCSADHTARFLAELPETSSWPERAPS